MSSAAGSAGDFGTDAIRRRVLDAWSASPARFREDANAEEDYAHRAYADRLVFELAQNAADAAAAGGVPGRLRFVLTQQGLYAANTGAPLTAAGVESLSHLRASTKADGAIGRFGVGFKAVLAVSDAPALYTRAGGVCWSSSQTLELLASLPSLAGEIARRDGRVPVMRLPFDASPDPAALRLLDAGYDTVIVLRWRSEGAAALATELVEGADPTLQLFLPGLAELAIESGAVGRLCSAVWEGEKVTLGSQRWWVRTGRGDVPAGLLAARPVEDRERTAWHVTVAFALDGDDPVPLPVDHDHLLRAPQPTAEPLSVPALIGASVPLDTARAHAAPGPLTAFVLERAAAVYAAMLADAPPRAALLDLVPIGLPAGQVDSGLRSALADHLATAQLFASAADAAVRLRPAEAAVIEAGNASYDVTAVLAPLLPQLLTADHLRRHGALAALGIRRLDTADVVDLLAAIDEPPSWWAALLAALSAAPDRDALRGLRVPLADGRMAPGPRDLLLAVDGIELAPLVALGISLRVVHPDAVTPKSALLLRSLGAVDADAGTLLDEPALREAVEESLDEDPLVDPDDLAAAVLSLAALRPQAARSRPWLADLALRNSEGELQPAGELLLPASAGGRLVSLVGADAPFGVAAEDLVARHGAAALEAVGVLRTFAIVRAEDVAASPDGAALFLDGESDWLASLDPGTEAAPPLVIEVVGVRDLEWVAADKWHQALTELATPELYAAVTEPARLLLGDGRGADRPSYTRWWLGLHPCVPVAGHLARAAELRTRESSAVLAGLYDVVPDLAPATAELVVEIGTLASVEQLLGAGPEALVDLLDRLGDPSRSVERHQLRALYGPVCDALAAGGEDLRLPEIRSVRGVVRASSVLAVAPADAVVIDRPDLLGLVGTRPVVPVPLASAIDAADVLDVPLAAELSAYAVRSAVTVAKSWGDLPGFAAAVERLGLVGSDVAEDVARSTYDEYEHLVCADLEGVATAVAWRLVEGRALVSRDQLVQGASRALAALLGCWQQRNAVAAMLAYPDRAGELLAEAELE
ncbi:MAG: hypothetical protein ABI912_02405 [Actinomycetota bacterium]